MNVFLVKDFTRFEQFLRNQTPNSSFRLNNGVGDFENYVSEYDANKGKVPDKKLSCDPIWPLLMGLRILRAKKVSAVVTLGVNLETRTYDPIASPKVMFYINGHEKIFLTEIQIPNDLLISGDMDWRYFFEKILQQEGISRAQKLLQDFSKNIRSVQMFYFHIGILPGIFSKRHDTIVSFLHKISYRL